MNEIVASLVFDSWTEPIPELRSQPFEDRHLIYECGDMILDLLLKRQGSATVLHIGGQLLPSEDPLNAVSDITVMLESGKHRSCTHTNALGEFAFHMVPNGTFDLVIILKNRRFEVRFSNKEPRQWRVVPLTAEDGERQ